MDYKSNSKEEALQEFGREIIKALKKTNPESREHAIKIFRDIKDRNLLRKASSYEESSLFEYMSKLDNENPRDVGSAQLHGEVNKSMVTHLEPYRDCLTADDVKILRSMDIESEFSGDYSSIVDWFDYGMEQRRKFVKNKDSDYDSK